MRDELLACQRLFVDKTRAPVQDPGRGQVKTGYFWAIARDDRVGRPDPPAVVYTYALGRGAEHAVALLGGFVGVLQTDGGACPRADLRFNPGASTRASPASVTAWRSLTAGHTSDASSLISPKPAQRPWRRKPCAGSVNSTA